LINSNEIDSVLIGGRRYIIWQSWLDYLERQKQAEENGIGRIASPNPRARMRTSATADSSVSAPSPAKSGQSRIGLPANPAAPPRRPRGRPPKPRSMVRT